MVRRSNPGRCEICRTRPEWPWDPPSLLYMGTRYFPGKNRPGRGVDHPPPSSVEVKGRVELYFYSPSGPSWPLLWWNLPSLHFVMFPTYFLFGPNISSVLCSQMFVIYVHSYFLKFELFPTTVVPRLGRLWPYSRIPYLNMLFDGAIRRQNQKRFLTSGICKLKCHIYNNIYVGQSESQLKTRFQECLKYENTNNPHSAYAYKHMFFNNQH